MIPPQQPENQEMSRYGAADSTVASDGTVAQDGVVAGDGNGTQEGAVAAAGIAPPKRSGIGRTLAFVIGALALATAVVLGSFAILDWWESRSAQVAEDDAAGGEKKREKRPNRNAIGKVYSPFDAGFEAAFPKRPKRGEAKLLVRGGTITVKTYSADTKKTGYLIARGPAVASEFKLRRAARAAAKAVNAKVVSTAPATHQEYQALRFKARAKDPKRYVMKGLLVLAKGHIYEAVVVERKDPRRHFRQFVDSFFIK